MKIDALWDRIGQPDFPPVVLLGPGKAGFNKEPFEPVLAERAAAAILAAYVDPSVADMAYSAFYADERPVGEIVLEAQTPPFLAERRVILVRNAEHYGAMSGDKKSPLAPLIEYLKSPSEFTILVFIAKQADARKKFYKGCAEAGVVVECPQMEDRALSAWVRDHARQAGKKIDGAAAQELVGRAGGRLGDVENALTLVMHYVGDADQIHEEDVVAACADVAEESVWALTDAIAASDPRRALATLHQLLDLGKSPDEIMGLINWLLESAYRALPATTPQNKSPYVSKKVKPLADKLGVAKLPAALALCTDTHFLLRSTGVDTNLALELLVVKLAAPRTRRRVSRPRA